MTTKLNVTVAVDLDVTAVTVRPAGRLTTDNVRGILAVVHRAERTLPGFSIQLDLNHARTNSSAALRALGQSGATIVRELPVRIPHGPDPAASVAA